MILKKKKQNSKRYIRNMNSFIQIKKNKSLRDNYLDKINQNKENITNNTFIQKSGKNKLLNNNELFNDNENNHKNNYLYNKKIVSKNKKKIIDQNIKLIDNDKIIVNVYNKNQRNYYDYV